MTVPVHLVGSKEYVRAEATVTTAGVTFDTQPVTLWLDGVEHTAQWYGSVGAVRRCRTTTVIDFTSWEPGLYSLAVEVTDSPEIPLIPAGYISVQNP